MNKNNACRRLTAYIDTHLYAMDGYPEEEGIMCIGSMSNIYNYILRFEVLQTRCIPV